MDLLALLIAMFLPATGGLLTGIVLARRQTSLYSAIIVGVPAGLLVQVTLVVLGYIVPYGQIAFWFANIIASIFPQLSS